MSENVQSILVGRINRVQAPKLIRTGICSFGEYSKDNSEALLKKYESLALDDTESYWKENIDADDSGKVIQKIQTLNGKTFSYDLRQCISFSFCMYA